MQTERTNPRRRALLVLAALAFAVPAQPARAEPVPVAVDTRSGVFPGAQLFAFRPQSADPQRLAAFRTPCTLGFLFSGSDRRLYMTTAGRCVLGAQGQRTWRAGRGPAVADAAGRRIGEFAFAMYQAPCAQLGCVKDFALVRLDARIRPSPQVGYWGGPVGVDENPTGLRPITLRTYGAGVITASTARARTLFGARWDLDIASVLGPAQPGDAGSPVITSSGWAIGHVAGIDENGLIMVVRLGRRLDDAGAALRISLRLRVAPVVSRS